MYKVFFYKDSSFSDHSIGFMKFDFEIIEKGPGIWVLNNCLLDEERYYNRVSEIIEEQEQCPLYNEDVLIWWDNFKYKIKKFSQIYSKDRSKEKFAEFNKLQNKLNIFSQKVADGKDYDIDKYQELRAQLESLEREKCKGAILRSKAKWAIDSDRNTKYFLNLEKYRQNNNVIKELKSENGNSINDTDSIMNEIYNYYSKLYSSVSIDDESKDEMLSFIDSSVSDEDREQCDMPITLQEIKQSLFTMAKSKSPGPDGLTVEFYCKFFNKLGHVLLKLFNNIQEKGKLSRSMRLAVISLIYKNKGDKSSLRNWRPISLLNVDYKILARIMSNRLKRVLPSIISPSQTCCVIGRDIADTIVSIRDVIDVVEQENIEGYVLKIDQKQAFDRVSHDYLFSLLEKFGFGPNFISWIKIFYSEIFSSVKCNGYISNYFPIKNSVKQGCPLSALLYTLVAEPLCKAICRNPDVRGIPIPNTNSVSLVYQHADDTTITLCNKQSIDHCFNVFELYGRASGSVINRQKSQILCIGKGSITDLECRHLDIELCDSVIEILGVYLGKSQVICDSMNWGNKVTKIKNILNMWQQRQLSIQGRATVISTLLLSRCWYTLMVQSIPEKVKNDIKLACLHFLWSGRSHLVAYQTVIAEKSKGGLNLPDIQLKLLAFRLKFLKRFLDSDCKALWKETMLYFLSKILDMRLSVEFLFLQLNKYMVPKLPLFYQELVRAWHILRENKIIEIEYNSHTIYNQPVFCNPLITCQNKCIFFKHFIKAGLIQIKHFTYEVVPGFLPSEAVEEILQDEDSEYSHSRFEKEYVTILQSIPSEWKNIINDSVNAGTDVTEKYPIIFLNISDLKRSLNDCDTKFFYTCFRFLNAREPHCYDFWIDLGVNFEPYCLWQAVNLNCKTPDMIDLDYRIVHNKIFTMEKLHLYNKVDSNICKLCQNECEDMLHLFYKCPLLKEFLDYIARILEELYRGADVLYMNKLKFEELILIGYLEHTSNVNKYFINIILSIVRFCIFKRRNVCLRTNRLLDIKYFFKFTCRRIVSYMFHYYSINNKALCDRYFLNNNLLMKVDGEEIHLQL